MEANTDAAVIFMILLSGFGVLFATVLIISKIMIKIPTEFEASVQRRETLEVMIKYSMESFEMYNKFQLPNDWNKEK